MDMRVVKRKQSHLRTIICMMLVLAMVVTILPENVQAEMVNTPGFTLDLTDLERPPLFSAIGKAGPACDRHFNRLAGGRRPVYIR